MHCSQVVAEDPDSGTNGQVEYDIASPNSPFAINHDTGEVSTRVPLDYETQRRHDIIVQVCSSSQPASPSPHVYSSPHLLTTPPHPLTTPPHHTPSPHLLTSPPHNTPSQACDRATLGRNCSTAEVVVYVTDFNDEFPLFDFSTYRTDICHSLSPNVVFMQPVAFDRDSGSNAHLTYSLDVSPHAVVTTGHRHCVVFLRTLDWG